MVYKLDWDKYDWREFEKICYEYIKYIYSAKFYKVKLTRAIKDSGRDIIIKGINDKYEAWGECKNHTRNIDLSVIGKNVVLALSHQINKAIFFSITNITANTKIEILNVAQKHNFEVLFLDGDELNYEIIKCEPVAKKYFRKEYEQYINQDKNNVWVDSLISEYPFGEDAKNNTRKQYHLENSFQIYLHLLIKNMNSYDISYISVELTNVPDLDVVFYEHAYQCSNGLSSYSDLLYTFRGTIFSPQNNIPMPNVNIKYTFSDGRSSEKTVITGAVDASDVWRAPYINSKTNNFFAHAIRMLQNVIPQNHARIFYIYGRSGMGKSRLIHELKAKAYECDYRVIHADFKETEGIYVLQLLIKDLLGISFSKTNLHFDQIDFSKMCSNRLSNFDINVLYKFLFFENIKYERLSDAFVNLVIEETKKDKLLFCIDNIQEMSVDLQRIFRNILVRCHKLSIPVCFIFAHNTERHRGKNNILVQHLKFNGEQYENFITQYHCDVLKEDDAILLMQQLLHLSSESNNFCQKILSKIELCPLDILLVSKYIEQLPGLLKTINGKRYLSNTNAFSLEQFEFPETFDTIVALRVSNMLNSISNPKIYNELFFLIVFFDGILKIDIFNRCQFDNHMLQTAKQNLILKINETQCTILFYHEKIYQYFKKQFCILSVPTINIIYDYYNKKEDKTIADYYYFIKILISSGNTHDALHLGFEILERYKNSIHGKYVIKMCDILQQVIPKKEKIKEYFKVIFLKADLLLERINISKAELLFEEAKEIISVYPVLFSEEEIIRFYHRYINQKLHTLQYEKAFSALEEFENLKTHIKLNSDALMIITDRRCVALYSLGKKAEALKEINETIKIAEKENNITWLSIAYSDKAFCHFYTDKKRCMIYSNFYKAISYYESESQNDDICRKIEIQIQKALIYILDKNYKNAKLEISQSVREAESADYGYLLIPSYNIQALIMILENDTNTANTIFKKALEYANIFSNPKAMVSVYNNFGSMYAASGNMQEAFNYYMAGLETLKKICEPQNCFRYMNLLNNIIKLSIILNKAQAAEDIISAYDFEDLKIYKEKCQRMLKENKNLSSFSYGVLSYQGYDYLY